MTGTGSTTLMVGIVSLIAGSWKGWGVVMTPQNDTLL